MMQSRFLLALAGSAVLGALSMAAFSAALVRAGTGVVAAAALSGSTHAGGWTEIDPRDVEAAALSRVESILEPVSGIAVPAPWETDPETLRRQARRRSRALAEAREAARTAFGAAAEQIAAFRPLFFPVADRFDDLPSAAQIAIAEAEASLPAGRWQGDTAAAFAQLRSEIEAKAGTHAADAYALRHAPAARMLRESSIELTANEYRQSFDALSTLLDPALEQSRYLEARQALRAALGPSRFAKLWSQHDPRYAELRRLTARHGIGAEKIDSAYIVLNDMQDALLAYVETASPDPARLRELYDAQKGRLGEVLGEDIAGDVLRGLSIWAAEAR